MIEQVAATTGRRRRTPWLDIINAQTPYLYDRQRMSDSRDLSQRQQEAEFLRSRRALASDREQADRMHQLQMDQDAAAAKQARTSQILAGTGTAVSAAAPYAGKIGSALTSGGGTGVGAGLGYAALGTLDTAAYRNWTGRPVGSPGFAADWGLSAGLGLPLSGTAGIRRAFGEDSFGSKAMDFLGGKQVLDPVAETLGLEKLTQDVDDWVDDTCIIVTACSGRTSEEVDITRIFRDMFLDEQTLRGYYIIAERVAPLMHRSQRFKAYIKKVLVDPLIDFGKFSIGMTRAFNPESIKVAENFLTVCSSTGGMVDAYIRKNGETV